MSTISFRRLYASILSLTLLTFISTTAIAQDLGVNDNVGFQDYQLQFNQEDLALKYGEYSEVEFYVSSTDQVEFLIEETKPVGMDLYPLTGNSVILSGLPEFVGKYCFVMTVKNQTSEKQATERVCLHAEDNDSLEHPKFETQSHLSIRKNNHETLNINLESRFSHITPTFVQGNLPEGLNYNEGRGKLVVSGSTSFDGVFTFLVLAQDNQAGQEFYVYKQFQIEVKPDIVDRYQCDTGYYYDETLGYCVQNDGDLCPAGTFYDAQRNSCVNYTRPTHVRCGPGSYYDHFLYRCVRNSYQRCPYNYEYDAYAGRCVRQPYTCSIGYRYSYRYQSCIYVGYRQCARGSHYSSYYGRCVRNYAYCRAGNYYDGYTCRTTRRVCRNGNYWDPSYRGCRSRSVYSSCRYGYNYDYGRARCIRRSVYSGRTCRGSGRYSPRAGRCVSYRPTHTRPHRPVVRPHRTRPVVVRPHRPTHRPNRPTVNRPNRPNRPTTRPNRPNNGGNRPTTRPNRPNNGGNRPTTRPNRPNNGGNRPTTRPNRPNNGGNRPTTRPNRPNNGGGTVNRPNRPNRPTTRPNRPNNGGNRPTTRPSRPSNGGSRNNGGSRGNGNRRNRRG